MKGVYSPFGGFDYALKNCCHQFLINEFLGKIQTRMSGLGRIRPVEPA
jgi:hypothetical protein